MQTGIKTIRNKASDAQKLGINSSSFLDCIFVSSILLFYLFFLFNQFISFLCERHLNEIEKEQAGSNEHGAFNTVFKHRDKILKTMFH